MRIQVRVEAEEVIGFMATRPEASRRAVRRWLPIAGQIGVQHIRREMRAHFKNPTGAAAGSVRAEIKAGTASVGPGIVGYPLWVNDGTRPHVIEAKNGRALTIPMAGGVIGRRRGRPATRFKFGGKTVYRSVILRKRVHHPGFRGYRYMEKAAETIMPAATRALQVELRREVGGP